MSFRDPFWGGRDPKRGASLLDQLIPHIRDPARFLESYYWSLEPGGIECMRAILALPPEARSVLHSFLTAAARKGPIDASLDAAGALKLFSCNAARPMTGSTAPSVAEPLTINCGPTEQ